MTSTRRGFNNKRVISSIMPPSLDVSSLGRSQELLKRGFATMQEGGVIMDVVNAEEAAVAEDAGAVAVNS